MALCTLVLSSATEPARAAHPGINGKIVYGTFGVPPLVRAMNPDGSGGATLGEGEWPAWSANGLRVAFVSSNDIYVMNADGSNRTRLTTLGGFWPTWSPDGLKIAFLSTRDGNYEIYVMNADGSGQTNITNHPMDDSYPAWSPDGSKIAFIAGREGGLDIWTVGPDGSNATNLTNGLGINWMPNWSPDGSKIAIQSTRAPNYNEDIWVMNADGSGLVDLTPQSQEADRQPAWSPDGSKIAFVKKVDDHYDVYVMNADGSSQTNVTNTPGDEVKPDWQPVAAPVGGISLAPDIAPSGSSAAPVWTLASGLAAATLLAAAIRRARHGAHP
jgi:TolB protein